MGGIQSTPETLSFSFACLGMYVQNVSFHCIEAFVWLSAQNVGAQTTSSDVTSQTGGPGTGPTTEGPGTTTTISSQSTLAYTSTTSPLRSCYNHACSCGTALKTLLFGRAACRENNTNSPMFETAKKVTPPPRSGTQYMTLAAHDSGCLCSRVHTKKSAFFFGG